MSNKLRVGWHRELFLSPLRSSLPRMPARHSSSSSALRNGEMQVKMKNGEIDVLHRECWRLSHEFACSDQHSLIMPQR